MAQERDKPTTIPELIVNCNKSFTVKVGCKLATITIRIDAMRGHIGSQFLLAELYRHGYYKGNKQQVKAEKWYLRAANQNHCKAQYWLASLYKYGSKGVSKNEQKSDRWLEKSALSGCTQAKKLYSQLLETKHSYLETKQRAEKGDIQAQFDLALLYNKSIDVINNNNHSFYWMFKAAEKDFAKAHTLKQIGLSGKRKDKSILQSQLVFPEQLP